MQVLPDPTMYEISMKNDAHLAPQLQGHFSVDSLAAAPAPLHKALHLLGQWLGNEHGNVYPTTGFADLTEEFAVCRFPAQGMAIDAFLGELESTVLANTAQLNHPMYIGHMTQALPWITVLAEAFAAALNQNQVKVETAYVSTLIEKQILGWLHRAVYGRDDAYYADAMRARGEAIGNMVNGGTMGNLTALAVALEQQLPGTRKRGLFATLGESGYRGVAVIGSARIHYSLKKAMATLGLGEDALHLVPVDSRNRIDLTALEAKVARLRADGIKLVAIVGIAGTTETGAIDPLAHLAAIAKREQAWFHVDAAWGGALLVADQYKPLFDGIALADSVVIDGHKLLWVPMAQSMVLFRDRASLNCLKHNANYIIRQDSGDLGQTSLEGSRRFDALKLWTAFKVLGASGYRALLEQAGGLSRAMQTLIHAQPDFELITDSDTFILTYRYAPAPLRAQLEQALAAGNKESAATLNRQLNQLNAALQDEQKSQGKSFVSRTVLESTRYPGDTTVLRIVLTNVMTTPAHLRAILEQQRQIGAALSMPMAAAA